MMSQLALFDTTAAASSPLLGLSVRLADRPTDPGHRRSGDLVTLGSSRGIHAAIMTCASCGRYRGWLPGNAVGSINQVRAKFGAPEIITLRHPRAPSAPARGHRIAPPTESESTMDMRSYSAKNYVKLDDVTEGAVEKVIAEIAEGSFDKPEATFTDGSKLSLNRTSVLALSKAYSWNSDGWIGRRVEIYAGEITFKGTTKPGIMVRPLDPPAALPPLRAKLDDDEIPF
jgi:hypothetical protein